LSALSYSDQFRVFWLGVSGLLIPSSYHAGFTR
jgi:hypothetical protein